MLPVNFDHRKLASLPVPAGPDIRRISEILSAIVDQRIVPYFKMSRGTDPIELGRATQDLFIQRLEDENGRIGLVSFVTRSNKGCTIGIHERIFDYLVFVTPLKSQILLGSGNMEESKMYAFAELLLRHSFEHILYPGRREQDVIRYDVAFVMNWMESDPTSYRTLRAALEDEMNGIHGRDYLELFDLAEKKESYESTIKRIVNRWAEALGRLPETLLEGVFTWLDHSVMARVLGDSFKESQRPDLTLVERAGEFQKFLKLLRTTVDKDTAVAFHAFNSIKERWGVFALFRELGVAEAALDGSDGEALFTLFLEAAEKRVSKYRQSSPPGDSVSVSNTTTPSVRPPKPKSLNERIEEAQSDPIFSQQALELIEKNRLNASGSSGAKYTELIETLLSIPWGSIRKISVSTEEFEDGLNRSHYGLAKPKEILCDFFSNLIWRYQHFSEEDWRSWGQTGSALLLVGPPGVGKTSLAVSIGENLGIPYHKISLGGMKDEADIRGYGFTYEGSKPGPIVQGLIKMGAMNGMFILDEADKTEKFAISTLLEILDPEQNHLFHDKYTQSTVDIDLSNAHFILTANTVETVPAPVLDRCEVIFLDRYSVEEKINIARDHLVRRIRQKYMIGEDEIFFDPAEESELLRYLVRRYTQEAGVRDLERVIRILFLRIHRKEMLSKRARSVRITWEKVRKHLDEPGQARQINHDDRIGEAMGIGVNTELGVGSLIPIQTTPVAKEDAPSGNKGFVSMVHTTGNIEKIMDESRKVALTAILHRSAELGINRKALDTSVHLHFMGASTKKDGPSAGGAIALALASHFMGKKVRRDIAMTGEIDTRGRIHGIGGLTVKIETASASGVKTLIVPKENLHGNGGMERLPEALKRELQILTFEEWEGPHDPFDHERHVLQVVAVEDILEAVDVAVVDEKELHGIEESVLFHAYRSKDSTPVNKKTRNLYILYLDDPKSVHPLMFPAGLGGVGSVLLINKELKDEILAGIPGVRERFEVQEFTPGIKNLSQIVENARAFYSLDGALPLRISVIAPLPFLMRDGIRAEDFPPDRSFDGLRLFGSFCSIENTRVRGCKGILNRTYYELSRLEKAMLGECPFLEEKNGIYGLSLSFIPEKYRLDSLRAEEILKGSLTKWLSIIEHGSEEHEVSDDAPISPAVAIMK